MQVHIVYVDDYDDDGEHIIACYSSLAMASAKVAEIVAERDAEEQERGADYEVGIGSWDVITP